MRASVIQRSSERVRPERFIFLLFNDDELVAL